MKKIKLKMKAKKYPISIGNSLDNKFNLLTFQK